MVLSLECVGVSVNLSQSGHSKILQFTQRDWAVTKPAACHTQRSARLQPHGLNGVCLGVWVDSSANIVATIHMSGLSEDPSNVDCSPPSGMEPSRLAIGADHEADMLSHVTSSRPLTGGCWAQGTSTPFPPNLPLPPTSSSYSELSLESLFLLRDLWLGHSVRVSSAPRSK